MKESKVLLLNDKFDLKNLEKIKEKYKAVICLFWAAPSTEKLISGKLNAECYSLKDIIKNYMEWGKKDYYFIEKIIQAGPKYENLYWRGYLAEPLYLESSIWLQIKTIQFIEKLKRKFNIEKIIIDNTDKKLSSTFNQILSNYKNLSYNQLTNKTQGTPKPGIFNKLREQFYEAYFSKDWKIPFMNFIEAKDKTYKYRTFLGKLKKKKLSKGNITFFSSYINNSRRLSCFTDLMPCPVNWIIGNYSAYKGMPKNSNYQWIWQFSNSKNEKTKKQKDKKININKKYKNYGLIKTWLENTETWKNWQDFSFSALQKLTRYWENYLDEAKPRLIVIASPLEIGSLFTKIARARGIPVLQIMHGLRVGYLHTQTPIISDYMTVYGNFWKDLCPKNQHRKIRVYNPNIIKIKKKTGKKPNLTFFLWPLKEQAYYNESEFIDGFIHIFHKLLKKGYKVTTSCHPLANPSYFLERWKNLYGTIPSKLYFIKEELSKVLEKTDLALMFISTCMLDCMLNKIPVAMPGWIDFSFNKEFKKIKGVYLAEDFEDLEKRIFQWLKNPPTTNEKQIEYFVQTPEKNKGQFRSFVRNLIKK